MRKIIITGLIVFLITGIIIFSLFANDKKTKNNTIEDITYIIFNELKLDLNYNNIEDLLKVLNISENYDIKKSVEKNTIQSGEGFLHLFNIVSEQYNIWLWVFSYSPDVIDDPNSIDDPIRYYLSAIEIQINDNNFLHLFPYIKMEEYMSDNNFGEQSTDYQQEGSIYYYMRHEEMGVKYNEYESFSSSELKFNNGLLKSITITTYFP